MMIQILGWRDDVLEQGDDLGNPDREVMGGVSCTF